MIAFDRRDHLSPTFIVGGQLFLAQFRDLVKLRALVAFALLPFRLDPALTLQPVQRRIKRAGFHLQHVAGTRPNRLADSIAMLLAPLKRLQDQHVQRSLQDFNPILITVFRRHRL